MFQMRRRHAHGKSSPDRLHRAGQSLDRVTPGATTGAQVASWHAVFDALEATERQ